VTFSHRMGQSVTPVAREARLLALSIDLLGAAGFDGYLKLHNPAWNRALGYEDDELAETPYIDFIHSDDQDAARAVIERMAGGASTIEFVCRIRRKDGMWRHILWSGQGAPEDGCFYIVGKDITERRRLDRELENRAERLERINAELQDFAYIASHDLSEPLRMITSYLQLLQRRYQDQLDETADEFIHYAVDGAERMKLLIDDLLQYSRIGSAAVQRTEVDADAVLDGVLRSLEGAIMESGATVTHGPLGTVHGDGTQIGQLLQNLVANAIKFARPDVPAEVSVDRVEDPREWHVVVRDNGIGIEERHADRIFKMFGRLHGREEYEGTGIGLAICRRISDRHAGSIWVESTPGSGSSFHVSIPEGQ
jgi:PAS domain S-box-containing protein